MDIGKSSTCYVKRGKNKKAVKDRKLKIDIPAVLDDCIRADGAISSEGAMR
jgi:hypothetical protein